MMISSVANKTAAAAYARTQSGASLADQASSIDDSAGTDSGTSFGDALQSAIQGAVQNGKDTEAKAAAGLNGQGNLTDIVTSISQAQIVLQTASTVRDRVIQSYQDVMRMTI
ncbi:flagellar hook-basal body complex protein FliE [Acetobacter fallax]|uniref:Flagellar hook-basal body complex protein FliE n=1 Tax=Acetobacter fallax TaxID=1737473 RepID=A0ABX0K600_9PROT|nr:flagellar hook-basal body complex protein FliE [Acetobacter fallax]NHO31822.1 flagellar hook-basal body complex protein FliE [Acetobacter fallax]NHO35415.1 flagellar hook-basal body complex protein FliE [Acetobacter fallax]